MLKDNEQLAIRPSPMETTVFELTRYIPASPGMAHNGRIKLMAIYVLSFKQLRILEHRDERKAAPTNLANLIAALSHSLDKQELDYPRSKDP